MVKLLVDSGSDLNSEFLLKNNIDFLPFYVSYKGETVLSDLNWKSFSPIDYLDDIQKNLPEISQPPVKLWLDQVEQYLKEGNDILYLAISKNLSGGVKCFNILKNLLKDKYPERQLEVVDTQHVSSAVILITKKAIQLLQNNMSLIDMKKYLENFSKQVVFYTTGDSLKYYLNSGRTKTDEFPNGKPLIKMIDGRLILQSLYNTQEEVLEEICKSYKDKDVEICIATSWDLDIEKYKYGPTVSAVCGPHSINYSYVEKKYLN